MSRRFLPSLVFTLCALMGVTSGLGAGSNASSRDLRRMCMRSPQISTDCRSIGDN
jgi:hypothetical protein